MTAELRALLGRATPLPWRLPGKRRGDVELTVAAVNALPALLDAVDAARAVRVAHAKLREATDAWGAAATCRNPDRAECERLNAEWDVAKSDVDSAEESLAAAEAQVAALTARVADLEAAPLNLPSAVAAKNAAAAIARIRDAAKRDLPGWTGLDTDEGLAASVDTALEGGACAKRAEEWYAQAMTRLRDAIAKDELPYPRNDVAIDRLVAEFERVKRERDELARREELVSVPGGSVPARIAYEVERARAESAEARLAEMVRERDAALERARASDHLRPEYQADALEQKRLRVEAEARLAEAEKERDAWKDSAAVWEQNAKTFNAEREKTKARLAAVEGALTPFALAYAEGLRAHGDPVRAGFSPTLVAHFERAAAVFCGSEAAPIARDEPPLSENARKVRDYMDEYGDAPFADIDATMKVTGVAGWALVDAIVELNRHPNPFPRRKALLAPAQGKDGA